MSILADTSVTAIPTGTWSIDPAWSSLEFEVRKIGLVPIKGRVPGFTGAIVCGDEPSISGTADAASITTFDETRDGHLQSPEFFDTERYPELRFESREIVFAGDELVVTQMEHHSNLVPWQRLAEMKGAHLKYVPLTPNHKFDLAAFKAGDFTFLLVNVHLYFGDESEAASIERRCLETYAVARWADLNVKSKYAYATDIIALGDFNLPKVDPADPVFKALTKRGLQLPAHSTEIGSAIATDSHYDQIAFFLGQTKQEFTGRCGVYDFDGAVFKSLWETKTPAQFRAYVRYYLSDHRPLWAEFKI